VSIQISTQTQQVQTSVAVKKTAQKTNKLGAFAKVLDGLIAKQPSGEVGKQSISIKSKASSKITKNNREDIQVLRDDVQQSEKKPQKKEDSSPLGVFIGKNAQVETAGKKPVDTRTKDTAGKNVGTPLMVPKDTQSVIAKAAGEETAKSGEVEKAEKKTLKAEKIPQKDAVIREAIPILTSTGSAVSTNESFVKIEEKSSKSDNRVGRKIRDKFDVRDVRTEQRTAFLDQTVRQAPDRSVTVLDMAVDLRSNTSENTPVDHKPQTFADMLTRQLDDGLSSDIVRQATIVLKDGGQGVIRLSLKPETLGSVKIRLEMSENKVMGHIIVDSGDALRAFDKVAPSMEQAFKDSGFETATLSASLSNNDGRREGAFRGNNPEEKPFFSERFVAQSYDDAFLVNGYAERRSESINLLA
jgi:flagellar hook-length control protein FliK